MAGRGTDIVLGGMKSEDDLEWVQRHQKVIDAGGLHILGTERHESGELIINYEVAQGDRVIQGTQNSFYH